MTEKYKHFGWGNFYPPPWLLTCFENLGSMSVKQSSLHPVCHFIFIIYNFSISQTDSGDKGATTRQKLGVGIGLGGSVSPSLENFWNFEFQIVQSGVYLIRKSWNNRLFNLNEYFRWTWTPSTIRGVNEKAVHNRGVNTNFKGSWPPSPTPQWLRPWVTKSGLQNFGREN